MKQLTDAYQLKVYIAEDDHYQDMPLYEWIIREAQQKDLAGATVIRALAGFGASKEIHTSKVLRLAENLPLIIEIIDNKDKIEEFARYISTSITEGLMTLEKLNVHFYRQNSDASE